MAAEGAHAAGVAIRVSEEGVAESVANKILGLVKDGNLRAGDRLPAERLLVDIFMVSRPALREALRSLSVLGVIRMRHGGGAHVVELHARPLLAPLDFFIGPTPDNLRQAFECRRLIEMELLRKATQAATAADLQVFDAMLATQKRIYDDPVGFRMQDSEFHHKLYALAGNEVMERLANGFYNLALELRRKATASPLLTRQSVEDHGLIVEAIRRRDGAAAAEAMARHVDHIEQSTFDAMAGEFV